MIQLGTYPWITGGRSVSTILYFDVRQNIVHITDGNHQIKEMQLEGHRTLKKLAKRWKWLFGGVNLYLLSCSSQKLDQKVKPFVFHQRLLISNKTNKKVTYFRILGQHPPTTNHHKVFTSVFFLWACFRVQALHYFLW